MGRSLSEFAASMRNRAKELPVRISNLAREGAEAVLRDWVDVMPVDTSEAISNTRIGVGSRPVGSLRPFFSGHKGSTREASAGKALEEGLQALSQKKPGEPIYISNTARHIGRLDSGSSVQFAGGFIPRGVIIFREAVNAAARKLSDG